MPDSVPTTMNKNTSDLLWSTSNYSCYCCDVNILSVHIFQHIKGVAGGDPSLMSVSRLWINNGSRPVDDFPWFEVL